MKITDWSVETLLDHGINASTNIFKSSVAWLIRKMLMKRNSPLFFFFFFFFCTFFFGRGREELFGLEF